MITPEEATKKFNERFDGHVLLSQYEQDARRELSHYERVANTASDPAERESAQNMANAIRQHMNQTDDIYGPIIAKREEKRRNRILQSSPSLHEGGSMSLHDDDHAQLSMDPESSFSEADAQAIVAQHYPDLTTVKPKEALADVLRRMIAYDAVATNPAEPPEQRHHAYLMVRALLPVHDALSSLVKADENARFKENRDAVRDVAVLVVLTMFSVFVMMVDPAVLSWMRPNGN